MNDARAILGTFSDYRPVKSRSVLQIIVEVPIERSKETLERLGYPIPGQDLWCAVARVDEQITPEPTKRSWDDLKPSQQMGIACNDPAFQRWLEVDSADDAATWLRQLLAIKSRADADHDEGARAQWEHTYRRFLDETRLPERR